MTRATNDAAASTRLDGCNLVVEKSGRRILDGATLAVRVGEIAVIEGASGSGKSTLLRVLATLMEMNSGVLRLDGIDSSRISPVTFRTRVAYVPQHARMFEGTVADNVATGPRLSARVITPAAIDALLERVGLPTAFATRIALELSGGEQQRVGLARALANAPDILLLDEPTSALDPSAASHVVELVKQLARDGVSVIVVTHIEEQAKALCGTRYQCANGRLARRND